MESLSALFGAPPTTCWRAVVRTRDAINSRMYRSAVVWPDEDGLAAVASGFRSMKGIRDAIGCMDGTHIPTKASLHVKSSYLNRKGRTSIAVLEICDHRMRFTYGVTGAPGCVHDARVWRECPRYQDPAYALLHFWFGLFLFILVRFVRICMYVCMLYIYVYVNLLVCMYVCVDEWIHVV